MIKRKVTKLVRKGRRETEKRVIELMNSALSRFTGTSQGKKPRVESSGVTADQPGTGRWKTEETWVEVVKRRRRGPKPAGTAAERPYGSPAKVR